MTDTLQPQNRPKFDFWQSYFDSCNTTANHDSERTHGQLHPDVESEMAVVKGKIADIKAEIMRLHAAVFVHESQLQRLRLSAQGHTKLPQEIWARIFSLLNRPLDVLDLSQHPLWILRQVSSRWRFIAMNNPSLWSWIRIAPPNRSLSYTVFSGEYESSNPQHSQRWNHIVNKALTLLPCSGPVAIDVDFTGQKSSAFLGGALAHDLTKWISAATQTVALIGERLSPRIRHLTLKADHTVVSGFLSESLTSLSQLESLGLGMTTHHRLPSTNLHLLIVTSLLGAKNIKRLMLNVQSLPLFPTPQQGQILSNLTALTIDVGGGRYDGSLVTTDTILDFLSVCPSLYDCSIQCQSLRGFYTDRELGSRYRPPGSIQLGDLQVLRVIDVDPLLLEALALPSLNNLSLCNELDRRALPTQSIIDLIERSSCSIVTFSHYTSAFNVMDSNPAELNRMVHPPVGQLEALLAALPDLEDLATILALDEPDTLQRIAKGALLPNLRSICCGTTQDPVHILEQLSIRFSRGSLQSSAITSLKRAIVFSHSTDLDVSAQFKQTSVYRKRIKTLAQQHSAVEIDAPGTSLYMLRQHEGRFLPSRTF